MKPSTSVSSESNALSCTEQHPPSGDQPQWSLNTSIVSESRRRSDRTILNYHQSPLTASSTCANNQLDAEVPEAKSPLQSLLTFTVPEQKRTGELSSRESQPPAAPPAERQRRTVPLPESPSLELLSNLVPYTWLEPPMPVVSRHKGEFSPSLAEEWTTQVRNQRKAKDLCSDSKK